MSLTLVGCLPYEDLPSHSTSPTSASVAGAWRVVELDDQWAEGQLVIAPEEFRLSFCNDLSGALRVEEERLVPVHPFHQTERACVDPNGGSAASMRWDHRALTIFHTPLRLDRSGDIIRLSNS